MTTRQARSVALAVLLAVGACTSSPRSGPPDSPPQDVTELKDILASIRIEP